MKTIVAEEQEINIKAAQHIKRLIDHKPDAAIALTAGRSTAGLYSELCRLCAAGELSFDKVRLFAVTEFIGAKYEHSCRAVLERQLIEHVDLRRENIFYPDGAACQDYDAAIAAAGGLDMAVLGIGLNGRIGYNEPATFFDTRTHVQKLTDATKRELAAAGFPPEAMPQYAVTMGIKTIVDARDIILLAFGEEKADPVFQMVYGKTITYIPASFLQIPLSATVYLDPPAAAKL